MSDRASRKPVIHASTAEFVQKDAIGARNQPIKGWWVKENTDELGLAESEPQELKDATAGSKSKTCHRKSLTDLLDWRFQSTQDYINRAQDNNLENQVVQKPVWVPLRTDHCHSPRAHGVLGLVDLLRKDPENLHRHFLCKWPRKHEPGSLLEPRSGR